jgi:TIR domain
MGFRAPRSEDVYRYMLRLDQRNRTLTDRFGWSIVLVGDHSSDCRDFLLDYCLDLCARTADRIRFVFFSELPDSDFGEIARRANQGRSSGILGGVLRKLRAEPTLDFEKEYWSDLRPEAILPFSGETDIVRHLGFERTSNTAMPGAAESLKFAQRLGIGRYVPCILVFTDIGSLTVHVLPFNERRAHEVYRHVRTWIDSYYELNRSALDTWTSIEDRIRDLSVKAERSLSSVRQWPSRYLRDLEALRWTARLAQLLEQDEDAAFQALATLPDGVLPTGLLDTLRRFRLQLAEFDNQAAISRSLVALADRLAVQGDAAGVRRELGYLPEKYRRYLRPPARAFVKGSLASPQGGVSSALLTVKYLQQWQAGATRIFSKRRFKTQRSAWLAIARAGRLGDESLTAHKTRDYAAFAAAAGVQPLGGSAEDAVRIILSRLAEHYGVPDSSTEWVAATAGFRAFLTDGFREIQGAAPEPLLRSSLPLLIRDCFALGEQEQPSLGRVLGQGNQTESGGRTRQAPAGHETGGAATGGGMEHRDFLCRVLREEARHLSMAGCDRRSAFMALTAVVRGARADLEKQVLARVPAGDTRPAGDEEIASIIELGAALDEYEQAVDGIVYPHLRDPGVIEVSIRAALGDAADISVGEPFVTDRLRASISTATSNYHKASELLPEMKQEVDGYSPASTLAKALGNTLSRARMEHILSVIPGRSATEKIHHAVQQGRCGELLSALTRDELDSLLGNLGQRNARAQSDTGVRSTILVAMGLDFEDAELGSRTAVRPDVALVLREKIWRNEFDVFMAHHSSDKERVLSICRSLRSRGIYPWVDVEQIQPGTWFQDAIQTAARKTRSAAIILGSEGVGQWQVMEIRLFVSQCIDRRIPVIPVLLPGLAEIPEDLLFMRQLSHVRFRDTVQEEDALQQLEWGITGLRSPVNDYA